jgi:hypothetical protein
MDGGTKVDARRLIFLLSPAVCLLLILACRQQVFSHNSPSSLDSLQPANSLDQFTPTTISTYHPRATDTPRIESVGDEISYSDWLMGSESACCSGVIEWDDFHKNIQGYNKTYADIDACSFPLFINLDQGSIEGKTSGQGVYSEFDSARSQAQFSAVVVESWMKPLPTLDGWHFGGVLEVYILMDAARKGWIGDKPTWLEGTRAITIQTSFIGQTDQKGASGGEYTWSTQASTPVNFQLNCKACPLPEGFPPPPQP